MIVALLIGGQLYGFVGAFIALPIAAMLRETVVYFRRHLVLEPWPTVALPRGRHGIEARRGGRPVPGVRGAASARSGVFCRRAAPSSPDDERARRPPPARRRPASGACAERT